MTTKQAQMVLNILANHAGAYRQDHAFIVAQTSESPCHEYRFQGLLGFGGKFWNYGGRWYVTCYSENETPERMAIIEKVNGLLAELKATPLDAATGE